MDCSDESESPVFAEASANPAKARGNANERSLGMVDSNDRVDSTDSWLILRMRGEPTVCTGGAMMTA